MAAIFLVQSGVDQKSPEFSTRFDAIMVSLSDYPPDSVAGEWIFKATRSVSTLLSPGEEQGFLGTAKVTVDGDNVAFVSTAGRIEINFSGTLSKSRLVGQVGVENTSAKCEGAATSDKISINYQSLTPDGTVRGNVVLQRLPQKANDNEKSNPNPAVRSA